MKEIIKIETNRDLVVCISSLIWLLSNLICWILFDTFGCLVSTYSFISLFAVLCYLQRRNNCNNSFYNWLSKTPKFLK